jgi:hypothetical protein
VVADSGGVEGFVGKERENACGSVAATTNIVIKRAGTDGRVGVARSVAEESERSVRRVSPPSMLLKSAPAPVALF